jgi:hypothetical protein
MAAAVPTGEDPAGKFRLHATGASMPDTLVPLHREAAPLSHGEVETPLFSRAAPSANLPSDEEPDWD